MGLGVLEVKGVDDVPGTSLVLGKALPGNVEAGEIEGHESKTGLKYDRTGKVPILLVPQPSNDPNDPLNWPLWKRDCILAILCLISVIASTLSPLLAANSLTLVLILHLDFTQVALLTGYHLLGVGLAGFLFVATARIWGKRHLYLLGTLLIIISSAWGGASSKIADLTMQYNSLMGARVIQGIGLAPFEALVNASVGDLYHVHQRGARMAASNMALFGGAFFTPIIVGKITNTMGWQWTFYFIAMFTALFFPLVIFYVPETAYRRPERFNIDTTITAPGQMARSASVTGTYGTDGAIELPAHHAADSSPDASGPPSTSDEAVPAKVSFARSLLPFNGRKTDESFIKLVFRPLPLFLHPAVAWGCLIQGALIGWTVLIGVVLAAIFLGPPLWFTEVKTGYMYAGPFIGAVLGFLVAGLLSDWSTRFMIRRNNGVYEPEFRIVLVAAQLLVGCVGLYGFGYTASHVQDASGWFWPDFFFALEVMGMVLGAVASALYLVDAHREIAVEAFTCLLIFKNIFSFGLTYGAYGWLEVAGVQKVFNIIASIQVVICLLSVPMYVFGKRNRWFFHKHDLLKFFHVD